MSRRSLGRYRERNPGPTGDAQPAAPPPTADDGRARIWRIASVAFAAACLAVMVAAEGFTPIWNNDIGFHIRIGSDIWNDGAPPQEDHHSHTADGAPYLDHEWLAQLLFYATDRAFGVPGLVTLKGLLLLAAIALVAWASRGRTGAVLVAVALCAVVLLPRVQLRPHLLAWVLLGLLLVLQRRKSAVGTAAVLAVWANCHASFVLGVAMNVLANLGSHAESGRKRTLLACLASVAAPLLNPYGPAIYGFGSIIKDDVWFVSEWQPFQADAPYLWVFVALAGFVALDAVRRRQHRWLDLARVALLAGLSATAMRHTAEAALFLCPIVAVRLGSLLEAAPRWANAAACGAAAVLAVGMTVHLAVTRRPFRFTVDQFALPVAATSFIVRHDLQGRMFNDYNFGGYLLWRAWPRHRVFVDGRLEVYGPRGVLRDYLVASSGSPGAEAVLDKYGVAFAVVRPDRALAHALADDRDWELVYFDYNAAVFVRRGTNRELRRLRLLTPWGNRDRRMVAASIDEARYLLRENPWFFGGHKILAFLLYRTGDNRGAAEELRRYLDLWPQGRENVETKEMIGALARRDAWDR